MKNFKMLAKGISLALMLSLVLSTAVFADTATYTFQKSGYTYIQNNTSIYNNTSSTTSTGNSYNNEKVTFYKFAAVNAPTIDTVTAAAGGGLLLKLPMANLAIPEGATVTKATLKLLMRYNNATDAGTSGEDPAGPSLRLLLHNVNKTEGEAIVAGGAVTGNVQSVTNYLADAANNNFPLNTYTNGYINLSLASTKEEGLELAAPYSGTKIKDAFHTFDVTDLIKGGTLTEDRYILAQRGFLYDEEAGALSSARAYLLPQGTSTNNAAPVLTVEYETVSGDFAIATDSNGNEENKIRYMNESNSAIDFGSEVTVGAAGTTAGTDVRARFVFNKFTDDTYTTIAFLAVYDKDNKLLQVAALDAEMKDGSAIAPRMKLNQDLNVGDEIRSFIWNKNGYAPLIESGHYMNKVTVVAN